jgi:transposase, IS5 family
MCSSLGITVWRQSNYNIRKIKKLFRKVQKLKRSKSKDKEKQEGRQALIVEAHRAYIEIVETYINKVRDTIEDLREKNIFEEEKWSEIEKYMKHAERQIDQIRRRVLQAKSIPHEEKVFSIFEEHTEWISKGKAGVPQELGLKVCILEDQYGFILYHHVMQQQTDDQVAALMVEEALKRFDRLNTCSFDKGFYSPDNKKRLAELLDMVVLSSKGRPSPEELDLHRSASYIREKSKHSAVESAINALENHSLDRCPDHGIAGFKRYVALAVVARNVQILGNIIQKNKINVQKRIEGMKKRKLQCFSN